MDNSPTAPNDEKHPKRLTSMDQFLRQKLENAVTQYFYEHCSTEIHTLLKRCNWYITLKPGFLMLVIACPDAVTNWEVLDSAGVIGKNLGSYAQSARIRILPPEGTGTPFDIRVDELSTYDIP